MKVPYSIMHEHRDAFYHWHAMRGAGYIQPEGNYLLHIDHHDDMVCATYAADLRQMPQTPEAAFEFTDNFLGIADFIAPAIYQGLFSTVHILKNLIPRKLSQERYCIWRKGEHMLMNGNYLPFIYKPMLDNPEYGMRVYERRENGLNGPEDLSGAESLVLDVDLDYFCWDNSLKSAPNPRIEITPEAYREYMADRDHPMRILPQLLVRAREENGRYYLVYEQLAPRDKLPDEERVIKRIDRLLEWLKAAGITPKAIDICRSSKSGYLPAERAEFVEEQFLERLGQLYDLIPASYPATL